MSGPVFIGGASRSGKTLMRWILSSHSRLAISRRTDLWPRFFGRYGDLEQPDNLDRCLADMVGRKQVAALEPDVDALRRAFQTGPPTYARLFALLHEQYATRCAKSRWGDQTAAIDLFVDDVVSAYTGARVILMVRDPRDRHEALVAGGVRRRGAVALTTAAWCTSVERAVASANRHPGSCTVVRYESLVEQPEQTARDVCDFLDEDYEPAMIRIEAARRYDADRAATTDGSPISRAYVGRYRAHLAPRDVAFIQQRAATRMTTFGYRSDPIHLSSTERIRHVATRPLDLAFLAYPVIVGRNQRGVRS